MRSLFQKPQYDSEKKLGENLSTLFDSVARLVEDMNRERTDGNLMVVYSGNVSSGTVTVPLDTVGYTLFIAVIGGVPTLAVQHGGMIAGRGGNAVTATYLTATVAGTQMTFEASGTLEKLIVLQ